MERKTDDIFTVEHAWFAYDSKQPALADVSLTVTAGSSVVILGANGCGKSTLLKLLDGLYFPNSGNILAFGSPLTEEALRDEEANFRFRRKVGLVFQDVDVQLFSPSVVDEVAFAPLQLGLSQAEVEQRVDEALKLLRIEKLRDRAPHRLSGGEKRRVALASLMSLRPEVWLLDEPTTGLDPRSQDWLVDFMRQERQNGKTLVTATHDLDLASKIASWVIVFTEDHQIAAAGRPEDIIPDHELLHRCNLVHYHLPLGEAIEHG